MNLHFSKRSFLVNLSLLMLSLLLTLFVSEMALRMVGFEPMHVSPERDRFWKYDPLLGWVHQPGQKGTFETEQFRTTLHINEKGLRDLEHSYDRTDDEGRILVLGDSFAWGYGVEETERFSEQLASAMGVEVINAGVSGYSTDQELLWFQNEGLKYDADLVILTFAGNDIGDNQRNLVYNIYYKPRYVLEKGQLTPTGSPVPLASTPSKTLYSLSQRSALVYFLVQRYFDLISVYHNFQAGSKAGVANVLDVTDAEQTTSRERDSTRVKESFELTIALLNEIRRLAQAEGATFMIVATDAWWNGPPGSSYEQFIEALRAEEFHVLDVENLPGFDSDAMHIPEDGHWNPAGHAFVAKSISVYIRENQLFNPLREEKDDHDKP